MKALSRLLFFFSFWNCCIHFLTAQDSLIFINDNYIIGEVKNMDRGVLLIETDFSDSDFKIEWEGIKEIYTQTSFLITLFDGRRFDGQVATVGDNRIAILTESGEQEEVDQEGIVYLKSADQTFASRLNASMDVGFSFTKAQNLRQLSLGVNVGYYSRRWSTDLFYSVVTSNQEGTDPIRRAEGGLGFNYFLPRDWYTNASLRFFSSTEQQLDLRSNLSAGIGRYFIRTNQVYLGAGAGLNFNNEDFSTDIDDRQSLEGYFGAEYNMYDVGDLSLLSRAVAYPSFTESGRWRLEAAIDAKYDLPLDFYIRFGFNLNYDNQPVEGAGSTDYVFRSGIGWSW